MHMFLIEGVIQPENLMLAREAIAKYQKWIPGAATAGNLANPVKKNLQMQIDPQYIHICETLMNDITNSARLISHAIPRSFGDPTIAKYEKGMFYGPHVDNPIMARIQKSVYRSDMSITCFLNDPDDYEGGELVIEDNVIKGPAGSLICYPTGAVHEVKEVTDGTRLVLVNWLQSLIPEQEMRTIIASLLGTFENKSLREHEEFGTLYGVYNDLVRKFSQV